MDANDLEETIEEENQAFPDAGHEHQHQHHQQVINRLARIEGHVRAVKRMVEEDVSCPDVLTQIAAVRAALNAVGKVILEDHIASCMVDAVKDGDFERSLRDLQNSLDKFIR